MSFLGIVALGMLRKGVQNRSLFIFTQAGKTAFPGGF